MCTPNIAQGGLIYQLENDEKVVSGGSQGLVKPFCHDDCTAVINSLELMPQGIPKAISVKFDGCCLLPNRGVASKGYS